MRWRFLKASRRANTMSTIDVDALARLANEYFSAWPGADVTAPDLKASVPPSFSPQTIGIPGEAELRALLQPLWPVIPEAAVSVVARAPFDVNLIRRDFPILAERVNGRPLVWLDNAATTQKPQTVIDRSKYFYE